MISEWKKFISLTHCTLIFQHSHHLRLYIFLVILSISSFRLWRNFLVGCWSICTQLPQLQHPLKNDDLLTPPSVLKTTRSLTVPNGDLLTPPSVLKTTRSLTVPNDDLLTPPSVLKTSRSLTVPNDDLLTPPSVLKTTRSLTVPNLGCKRCVEPLWISGLSWRPMFVQCNVALRCRDAKQTRFLPAWFCGCVAWVIVRLHNAHRNSPSIL